MSEGQTEIADTTANAVPAEAAEKSETPSATTGAAVAKPKKRKSSYSLAAHPPCIDMIIESISNLADKNGSSFQAIKKYIGENFDCDMDTKLMPHIKKALKSGVASGKLIQMKGKGASGSFKIGNAVQTMISKPTKRQIASADAIARKAAREQKAAKRAAKRPKKKKHIVQKPSARKSGKKSSIKKPAAKKAAKKSQTKKSKAKKGAPKKGARKSKGKK